MSCNITSGFTLGCRDNTGGIKSVYIYGGTDNLVVTSSASEITDISGSGTFYKFEQVRQTSNFNEVINSNVENGTIFYDQSLVLQFHKMSGSLQEQISTLVKNPDLRIIVETNNGQTVTAGNGRYFLMGEYNGASLTAGNGGTGTAFGDLNGYSLTFTSPEPEAAKEIVTALSSLTVTVE